LSAQVGVFVQHDRRALGTFELILGETVAGGDELA
jgi:hypothetical protein